MIVDENNQKKKKEKQIHVVYIYKNQACCIRENDWNSHCSVYRGET